MRFFATAVQQAARAPAGGLMLLGPTLGPAPDPGTPLIVRAAVSPPLRTRLRALGAAHRTSPAPQTFIVVEGLSDSEPGCFVGAIVHEEGVLFSSFAAVLSEPVAPSVRPARFLIRGDVATGFVSVHGRVANFFVLGGGLPDPSRFWDELSDVKLPPDTAPISRLNLRPVPSDWLMPVLTSYESAHRTVVVVAASGPAVIDGTVFLDRATSDETFVYDQQREGLIHVALPGIEDAPEFVLAAPPSRSLN